MTRKDAVAWLLARGQPYRNGCSAVLRVHPTWSPCVIDLGGRRNDLQLWAVCDAANGGILLRGGLWKEVARAR